MHTEIRFPDLDGALNFRDMGGYRAADGRVTRWNTLYRSGTLHGMTAADLERLAAYGISHVYDLRSNAERRDHPSTLSGVDDIEYRFLDHERIPGDIARAFRNPGIRADHSRSMMMSFYRRLPFDFRDAYRALFRHLEAGDLPLVFNCTAGKDRTGVAAALVLTALGVRRDVVLDDYLLSARSFDRSCEIILNGKLANLFAGVGREVWEPVMRVDAAYLDAMFEEMTTSHGSVDNYLRQELGVSDDARERLRRNLLD